MDGFLDKAGLLKDRISTQLSIIGHQFFQPVENGVGNRDGVGLGVLVDSQRQAGLAVSAVDGVGGDESLDLAGRDSLQFRPQARLQRAHEVFRKDGQDIRGQETQSGWFQRGQEFRILLHPPEKDFRRQVAHQRGRVGQHAAAHHQVE